MAAEEKSENCSEEGFCERPQPKAKTKQKRPEKREKQSPAKHVAKKSF